MLKQLIELFKETPEREQSALSPQLAAAVLMVEVMAADHEWDDAERTTILELLTTQFSLSDLEAQALLEEASATQKTTHDLYAFTKLVNEHYENGQKYQLLVSLWRVAFADDQIDGYEDYIIRKIADLLNVDHSQFIRAKLEAQKMG